MNDYNLTEPIEEKEPRPTLQVLKMWLSVDADGLIDILEGYAEFEPLTPIGEVIDKIIDDHLK